MEAILEKPEGRRFLPLSIDLLVPRSPFNADIYFKVRDEMVLFRKRGLPLTQRRISIWREMGVKWVYLDADDHRVYLEFLQQRLPAIMQDERKTLEEKARFLYSLAGSFFEEMTTSFDHEAVQKSEWMVREVTKYLHAKGVKLGKKVIKMMSHDFATYVHLNNVFFLAATFAVHRKLPPREVERIGLAAVFHDIGKERVDSRILQKPGKLDPQEWKEMKKHPILSRQELEQAGCCDQEILGIVQQHHETLDGKGYPEGLRDGEIHPYARLIQVCDIFEALCGIRPYRRPFTPFEALKLMKEEMKGKIDWELYRDFVRFLGPEYYSKLLKRRP